MVKRNENLSFGGMWAFPGGGLEPEDGPVPEDLDETSTNWGAPSILTTAAQAAVRETREETGLEVTMASLSWFAHWVPPTSGAPKRFATWFFIAPAPAGTLVVDPAENSDAVWIAPHEALAGYERGDFPMAVPTWCTLDDISSQPSVGRLIDSAATQGPRMHHTKAFADPAGRVLCWIGDAAYENGDLGAPGPRNRLLVDDQFVVIERTRTPI